MRLHTDKVTFSDLYAAASVAQVSMETFTQHGSRARDHAFEVKLVGTEDAHSARRPNSGRYGRGYGDIYAASWDQWGIFLRHLYEIDPTMVCGSPTRPVYANLSDFDYKTDGRFLINAGGAAMWPLDEHGDHRWQPGSEVRTRECTKCSARQIFPREGV